MTVQASSHSLSSRKSLWKSNLITFGLLGLFLLLVFAVEALVHPIFNSTSLVITGAVMSLVPAFLWLVFFYRQDQLEPEPKSMVFEVFILGGLLAAAIGIPLIEDVFKLSSWLYSNLWIELLGSVLVIGFTQETLKWAAVRFSVYKSIEFDEPTDGIIYATAAGLGFATVLNISFIVNSGGANLGIAAIRIVLTALAQASFAGISGYFLACEKFEGKPIWWMPCGVALAALLNGVFFTLWGSLTRPTLTGSGAFINPWLGLAFAVLLSLAITVILSLMIQKNEKQSSPTPEVKP